MLLRGPSGSGKSDLALRLIDHGAVLVADDQVELRRQGGGVIARPPAAIAGLIEVRGIGIVVLDHLPETKLAAIVDLAASDAIERLPLEQSATLLDVVFPRFLINPWEQSAAAKVRLAVGVARGSILRRQ